MVLILHLILFIYRIVDSSKTIFNIVDRFFSPSYVPTTEYINPLNCLKIIERKFFIVDILGITRFIRVYLLSNNLVYLVAVKYQSECVAYILGKLDGKVEFYTSHKHGIVCFSAENIDYKKILNENDMTLLDFS